MNLVKAALLLYRATNDSTYLGAAIAGYTAARYYFLDSRWSLYTTYVFDDGTQCSQLPHRYFASVNGDMIWSAVELFRDTGEPVYMQQANATATAVSHKLSDGRGVFADLQAENDVVEPLVEGMYALATQGGAVGRSWLLGNASVALSARTSDGSFGRFFDGPPPRGLVTAWQTSGGLALEVAAAALAPRERVGQSRRWARGRRMSRDIRKLPSTLSFTGSGIAVFGTLGERCCTFGHARVLIDGRQTFDYTGIWQNKSSSRRSIPDTVLFTWRWRKAGRHTLRFLAGIQNPKEGGSFLHLVAYTVVRH